MARIKYILNERRLALDAALGPSHDPSTLPTHIPWSGSPSTSDPFAALDAKRGEAPPEFFSLDHHHSAPQASMYEDDELVSDAELMEAEEPDVEVDTEQEKQTYADEPVVEGETVAKEEIESRDEGWGGGEQAKKFAKGQDKSS